LLVLLVAVAGTAHADPFKDSWPPVLDQHLPGFSIQGDRYDWLAQRWALFADSEVPWIRTYAQLMLLQDRYGYDQDLYEDEYLKKQNEIKAVLLQASEDPLSQAVVARNCNKQWCNRQAVVQKIIYGDSENLEPYLIAIQGLPMGNGDTPEERVANTDSAEFRALALQAADATHWIEYSDSASMQWYQAHLDFVAEFPPPSAEQRKNPGYLLAFQLGNKAFFESWHGKSRLQEACAYWAALNEPELTTACAQIAVLFKSNPSVSDYWLQRDILTQADPFDPEGLHWWRLAVAFVQVEACLEPRWMTRVSSWPAMDESVFELFLKTQVHSGRWQAKRLAAMNEYSLEPSRYPLDPARCELVLEQDSEAIGAFLGDQDPKAEWIEMQNRYLGEKREQEQPFVQASPTELAAMVAQLDHVDEVDDPIVSRIGRQGLPALPLLLDKLCSEARMTSLAAAYSIGAIGDPSAIPPLLEAWAQSQVEEARCEIPTAIYSLMEQNKASYRKPSLDRIDADVRALLDGIVCDQGAKGLTVEVDSNGRPFKRFVVTNGVANVVGVECAGVPIELRPLEAENEFGRFKSHDVYVARMYLELLDLAEAPDVEQMPAFIQRYGSGPEALALVVTFQGSSGVTELWVKTATGWALLETINHIMI
jgi:hypothetical protein